MLGHYCLSVSYGAIFPCIVMNCCINSIHSYSSILVCHLFLPLHDDVDNVLGFIKNFLRS